MYRITIASGRGIWYDSSLLSIGEIPNTRIADTKVITKMLFSSMIISEAASVSITITRTFMIVLAETSISTFVIDSVSLTGTLIALVGDFLSCLFFDDSNSRLLSSTCADSF